MPTTEKQKAQMRAASARYFERNKDAVRARRSKQVSENRAEIHSRQSTRRKAQSVDLRLKVLAALGGRCVHCGNADDRVLQVDHIDGGGKKHRAGLNASTYWKRLMNDLHLVQVLCANCHMIKTRASGWGQF